MATVNKSVVVPYTSEQMFNLVNRLEDYPTFLPWCRDIEIHSMDAQQVKATIHIAKGPLVHKITTHNTMLPNERISMQYIAGPFKECSGAWTFLPADHNYTHCNVTFSMDYEFKNKLSALAIEPLFGPIASTLIDAFCKRAEEVYGN
jgi:ribosome-associated toxin RatA of RatAB toxin-antitoxin module